MVSLCLLVAPADAFHTVFDFTVDRFEVAGNTFGPSPTVQEFDTMTGWGTPYGTSRLADGRLHVQSPGTHVPGPDGTTLDLTEVAYGYYVYKNYGDFVATAVFDPIIPPEGHFYHFTLYTFGGGGYFNEIFGVDVDTVGGETRIEQHLVVLDLAHGIYQTVTLEGRTLAPAEVTGQMHFRLAYDDAAGTIRSSFSVDGGVTFESPFSAVPIFTEGRSGGQFLLGADPHPATVATSTSTPSTTSTSTSTDTSTTDVPATTTVAPSSTTSTTLPLGSCQRTDCREAPDGGLDVRGGAKRRTIACSWRHGPALPVSALGNPAAVGGTAYALCIRDDTGMVFRQEIPAGGSCAARPCWRPIGTRGFAYKDARASNAVTALRVIAAGRAGAQVTATVKGPGLVDMPASPVTVQLETTGGSCWSARIAASSTRHTRRY